MRVNRPAIENLYQRICGKQREIGSLEELSGLCDYALALETQLAQARETLEPMACGHIRWAQGEEGCTICALHVVIEETKTQLEQTEKTLALLRRSRHEWYVQATRYRDQRKEAVRAKMSVCHELKVLRHKLAQAEAARDKAIEARI